MKILVTGGSGFIGSYVCDNLKAKGHMPIRFDHQGNMWTEFLGDVKNFTDCMEAVGSTDGVIHLAGVLGTQETITEPLPSVETNIIGSLNIFKAASHYRKRCVYIGVGNYWMCNSYSITKTCAEHLARMFYNEHGTEIAIVRGLNAYGPGQKSAPVRKIIPNFILPALNDEEITIYGSGSQIMDMIFVEDLAEILVRALLMDHSCYGKAFQAGTGRPTTVLDIAQEVIKQVGAGRIKHVPMRPGEPENSTVLGDPSTLYPLEFKDFTPLEEGIRRTVDWYRQHSSQAHAASLAQQ